MSGNCQLGSTTLTIASNFTLEGTATLHYAGPGFAVQSTGNYDTVKGLTFDGGGINLNLNDQTNWTGQYGWTIEDNTFENITNGVQAVYVSTILGKGPASAANSISHNRFYNIWTGGYPNFPPGSTVWSCGQDCMVGASGIWFNFGLDNTKIDYNYFENIGGDAIKGFWNGFIGYSFSYVAHNVEIAHNTMVGVHRIGIEVQADGGFACPGGSNSDCNNSAFTSDGTVIKDNFFHAPAFASDTFAYSTMVGGTNVLLLNNTGADEIPNNYWPLGIGFENTMEGGVAQGNVISSIYVENAGNYNTGHSWAGVFVSGYTLESVSDNFFNNVGCGNGVTPPSLVSDDPDNNGTMNEQADYAAQTCTSNPAASNIALSFNEDSNQTSALTFQVAVQSTLSIEQVQFLLDNSPTPIATQEIQDFNPNFATTPAWLYHVTLPAGTSYGEHTITAVATDVAGTKQSISQQFDYQPQPASAPPAPANVGLTAGDGQVAVTWSAVPGTTYSVFRGTASGGEGATPVASNLANTSFTDTGLTDGATYFYEVSASNPAGVSPMSNETSATPVAPVAIAGGALSGSFAPAISMNYNLTGLGVADWAAWGLGGGNAYPQFDHKATGGSQISDVGIVGAGAAWGDWSGYSTGKLSWIDGAPDTTATNEAGFYWSNGGAGTGFSFTAPADTNVRTLTIYAGACNATLKITAHLSDNSAPDFVDNSLVNQCSNGSSQAVYTLVYSAASAGQTLTIGLIDAASTNGGSINLMGATLNAGIATTAAPANTTAVAGNARVTLSWTAAAGAISYNVYRSTTPGGTLSASPINTLSTSYVDTSVTNGTTYYYAVQAVSVIGGGPLTAEQAATPIAPIFGSGSVSASVAVPLAAGQSYNLTQIGATDWIAWGENGGINGVYQAPYVDRKAGGNSQISDVTSFGQGATIGEWDDYGWAGLTWSDGIPDVSVSNETGYYWSNGSVGSGFSFTVPADTTTRNLWLYVGACSANAKIVAHLSDGSGADFVDTTTLQSPTCSPASTSAVYTFTYHAGSAFQTLAISIIKSADNQGGGGSVNLMGAALY